MSETIERAVRRACQRIAGIEGPDPAKCCATLIYGWESREKFLALGHRCGWMRDRQGADVCDLRPIIEAAAEVSR